ncbi:hypothetical protein L537_4704, partial [Bordetella hinzii 1277]
MRGFFLRRPRLRPGKRGRPRSMRQQALDLVFLERLAHGQQEDLEH